MDKQKINFTVKGMHCGSCETLIKDELAELPGASDAGIDFKTGQGSVLLNLKLNKPDDVVKAVSKAGYPATLEPIGNEIKIIQKIAPSGKPMKIIVKSISTASGK